MKFSFIRPTEFPADVRAYFTLKNAEWNKHHTIPGLNLGMNSDNEEIVARNRDAFLTQVEINSDSLALVHQIHSDKIVEVEKPGDFGKADGLISNIKGLTLGIKIADCAPVLMADTKSDWIAAIHAGWRGASQQIHLKTITMLQERGVEPENLKIYIGPCISAEKFEVGEEVAAQFPENVVLRNYKKPHVDLKQYLRNSLVTSGVVENHIEIDSRCTISDELFYSYRREGDRSGRMMAFIQRTA
jgi:YfiH family protein